MRHAVFVSRMNSTAVRGCIAMVMKEFKSRPRTATLHVEEERIRIEGFSSHAPCLIRPDQHREGA